jgi:N-acetylglutamate synthase-like GNAT family acetyltransferase
MDIRKATQKDVEELNDVNKKYFGEHRDYNDEVKSKDNLIFIMKDKNKIIGISGLRINNWNNTGWVFNIFVRPDSRKNGLGSILIQRVIKEAKKNNLRCLLAEAPSKGNASFLFKKMGFRKCGYNDRYYSNDLDEIAEFYSLDLI